MAARYRDGVDGLGAQFIGNLGEILAFKRRKSEGDAIVSSKGVLEGFVTGAYFKT